VGAVVAMTLKPPTGEATHWTARAMAGITGLGECLKLCVSDRVHAVFRYVQASKRPVNIMAS
jgi:hypothetical protein